MRCHVKLLLQQVQKCTRQQLLNCQTQSLASDLLSKFATDQINHILIRWQVECFLAGLDDENQELQHKLAALKVESRQKDAVTQSLSQEVSDLRQKQEEGHIGECLRQLVNDSSFGLNKDGCVASCKSQPGLLTDSHISWHQREDSLVSNRSSSCCC